MELQKESEKSFSEGTAQVSSGNESVKETPDNESNDTVSYATHKRLLNQKKKTEERLAEYETRFAEMEKAKKVEEEQLLKEQGEYKKLVGLREQKIDEVVQEKERILKERDEYKKAINDTFKLQAFYEKLPGKITNQQYLNFVDLDSIAYDPETGNVDEQSVDMVVNQFMEKHPKLVEPSKIAKLPSGYPAGSNKLTYDQWKSLPLKEMKKRIKDIVHTT